MRKNIRELEKEGIKPRLIKFLMHPRCGFHLSTANMYEYYRRKGIQLYHYCPVDKRKVGEYVYTRFHLLTDKQLETHDDFYDFFLTKDFGDSFDDSVDIVEYMVDNYGFGAMGYRSDPVMISMFEDGLLSEEDGYVLREEYTPFNIQTYDWSSCEDLVKPDTIPWEFY